MSDYSITVIEVHTVEAALSLEAKEVVWQSRSLGVSYPVRVDSLLCILNVTTGAKQYFACGVRADSPSVTDRVGLEAHVMHRLFPKQMVALDEAIEGGS